MVLLLTKTHDIVIKAFDLFLTDKQILSAGWMTPFMIYFASGSLKQFSPQRMNVSVDTSNVKVMRQSWHQISVLPLFINCGNLGKSSQKSYGFTLS